MLIDCHAHLALDCFDPDRDRVRDRARQVGIAAVLVVGEGLEDNRRVEEVVRTAGEGGVALVPCFGFHPDGFADGRPLPTREEIDATKVQIRDAASRLGAVGEVGLDYWCAKDHQRRGLQAALLEELAELAGELDLPLNVHSRSAGHYTIDLLRRVGARRVLMHAFDGKVSHAVRAAEAGYFFSIPPSVVRSPQKQKLVRGLPLESVLLESDSPVLGPVKDARNEPANVVHARDFIAGKHGVPPEEVDEITTENARRLFPALSRLV